MPPNETGDTKKPSPYDDFDTLEKPRIVYIPFGIKVLEEAPYIVIAEGIYVFAGNPQKTRIFQKICEAYPYIWQDQGPIDALIEHQMKIPLVEG